MKMIAVVAVLTLAACGGGSSSPSSPGSPAAPTSPWPVVAGTYTGTFAIHDNGVFRLNAAASVTVQQDGPNVSFVGSIDGTPTTPVAGTIDRVGVFTWAGGSSSRTSAACGTVRVVASSLVFNSAARTLNYSQTQTSDWCMDMRVSGTLRR